MTDTESQRDTYEAYISRVKQRGAIVKYPVELAPVTSLAVDGKAALIQIACKWLANVSGNQFLT